MSPTADRWSRPGWLPWLWAASALVVGVCGAAALLAWSDGYGLQVAGTRTGPLGVAIGVTYPVLGAAILTIHPRHAVGRVVFTMGVLRAASVAAMAWSYHGLVARPGGLPGASGASVVSIVLQVATLALLPMLLVHLPDGQAAPHFRWIRQADVGLLALTVLAGVVGWPARGPELLTGDGLPSTANTVADGMVTAVVAGQLALSALALVALISRLQEGGEVRQQLKWLSLGVAAALVGNTVGQLAPGRWLAPSVGFALLTASMAVAVFRYRLWDVDRLIKGTILYGALSVALVATFGATALIAASLLGTSGRSTPVACIATGMTVAALGPLRRWAQDRVDRLCERGTWDAGRRLHAFVADLAGEPPEPGALQALLRDLLDDPDLEVAYRLTGGGVVDPWGRSCPPEWQGQRPVEVVAIGGGSAEIADRPPTAADRDRFRSVVIEARMALEHGRMQAELHGQLVELRRSRVRLIAAIDTERRRIERNLHDGVQARLVALGLALRSRQRATRGPRDPDGEAAIDEAIHGIQEILGQVRGFAQGVMSPMLISEGLPGAVRKLADQIRTPVSTHVHVVRRPPDHVESTAWYVTCEGITNALKHAPGSPIRVWIDADADQLTVQVVDDGPGGADPELGTGLAGLQDRVEAVGGSLHVISPLGGGTVLRALLPCAS